MSEIYQPRRVPGTMLYEVVETRNGERADARIFSSWAAALRRADELNRPMPQQTAAPHCARCERLERGLEHYLGAMAEIWPTLGYPDQQEVALRAIKRAREMISSPITASQEK